MDYWDFNKDKDKDKDKEKNNNQQYSPFREEDFMHYNLFDGTDDFNSFGNDSYFDTNQENSCYSYNNESNFYGYEPNDYLGINLPLTNENENENEKEKGRQEEHFKVNASIEDQIPGGSTRTSKRKIDLSKEANTFKSFFYQIFTSKKKFDKKLVKNIHNLIAPHCNLRKISREEFRSIDLYFKEFSNSQEQILIYLHQHKENILDAIPELRKLN